mmetsp:Transcript_29291/g.113565  ORF Transcript_29291/g.113565 Transcript_29291/m.113565 type:complete len:311 (-) Transcript_29291:795-1727(-)
MSQRNSSSSADLARKRIHGEQDLRIFLESNTFKDLWTFVLRCNEAVKNSPISSCQGMTGSTAVDSFVIVLDNLSKLVDEIPPANQPARYGNTSFTVWHTELVSRSESMIESLLPPDKSSLSAELAMYLNASFGHEIRRDYGSGHEATFLILLFCLLKVGAFEEADLKLIVLRVFVKYLEVARKLQTTYWLEPAGSHGVWGLDDYSFLNFLWGSAQLLDSKDITPPSVVSSDQVLKDWSDEYLYVDAIRAIKRVKKGPFFEHSPMLRDISEVREGWPKINSGLIKMYRAEVWGKLPVVQHTLFGSIFKFDE